MVLAQVEVCVGLCSAKLNEILLNVYSFPVPVLSEPRSYGDGYNVAST